MAYQPAKSTMKSKKTSHKPKLGLVVHHDKALGLARQALPHSIVEVVSTLEKAGFDAYVVGGGVRDSLLGLAPKDFDAVTNARPHEIKAIFGGRCRIIGKRFQLAHVYSGREMIEVATFRAPPKDDTHTTEEGMITRDNVWGTIEQDFARRDFSINALYYQPIKGEVLDFCGAIDDVSRQTLRLLGDAKVRVEEDPVRLLRALRFKAKLGFDFDKSLKAQFHKDNWALLEQVSAHRLYDETQKMFCGGYVSALLPLLFQYGAMDSLMTHAPSEPSALLTQVAINTDKRVAQGDGVNPAFFYAALLWDNYLHALAKFKKKGLPFHEAQVKAAAKTMDAQRFKTAIPRFAEEFITQIWLLQPKLANPRIKEIANIGRCSPFRAAFDFLVLREKHDNHPLAEPTFGMAEWWREYQLADHQQKAAMIEEFASHNGATGMTRSRRKRQSGISQELEQLQMLSMRNDEPTAEPKPLFVVDMPDERTKVEPTPAMAERVLPQFAKVDYTDEYFMALLNNDEPYIPSTRYRKRQPSSTLSIVERQQGLVSQDTLLDASPKPKRSQSDKPAKTRKTAKPAKAEATTKTRATKAKAPKQTAKTPAVKAKPKTQAKQVKQTKSGSRKKPYKKSNAKPKADE